MKPATNIIKKFALLFGVLLLAGCMMPQMQIENLGEVKKDEVIFIGSLNFDPHIKKDEVIFKDFIVLGSDEDMHRTIYLKVSDTFYTLKGVHGMDIKESVAALEGDNYYFAWDSKKPLYFLGVSFMTRMTGKNRDYMTFVINKGIKVRHSGKAKAVYIGDITFKRDEFFDIKDIQISQKGYKKARAAFWKKYNTKMKVEVARLTRAQK